MSKSKRPSRREFLLDLGLAATGVATSAALAGCDSNDRCECRNEDGGASTGGTQAGGSNGVASGGSSKSTVGSSAGGSTALGPSSDSKGSGGTSQQEESGGGSNCPPSTSSDCPTQCPPKTECATPATMPSDWAQEADVIVLGTGFAGLAAAIGAADAGASVLVLEKMPKAQEGGNSVISGNMWWTPTSVQEGIKYITALCAGTTDAPYIETLAQEMMKLNDWLGTLGLSASSLGVFQPEYPELAGSSSVRTWSNKGSGGLWQPLKDAVTKRKVTIRYEMPAVDLIQDPSTREVKGLVATSNGQRANIRSRRGIVLACGGFEFDYTMQAQYLPAWPVFCQGSPGNTGDGIKMALKAGAALWHMNNSLAHVGCFVSDPTDPRTIPIPLSLGNNAILVDRFGARFMNEKRQERHGFGHKEYLFFFDGLKQAFSRIPCYGVFDETMRKSGKLAGGLLGWYGKFGSYTWSADNSAEVTSGWIKRAETLADLATAIGVDAATLSATVKRYNDFCEAGADQDFGRSASSLKAVSTAPFYAIPIYPLMYNTQGGPRRNEKCQIVDPFGKAIPRLYGAGELGSGWGMMYNGGGNASEAVISGRLAGGNAAGEGPWS
ncbi:MAG TPA: FAD-dependent oxidoreductase [Polyangiaceae bacterium]|nr:FAD-dependent oxidoreductase [Polyangiaceae bacterium]